MTNSRNLVVEHPNAQRLADIAGIINDLRLTIRACDLFLKYPQIGSEEIILGSKAVASFAILTYFRTLANGVRTGITKDQVSRLSNEHAATHHRLKNVRDHYIAHSINNQEENAVEITFKEDGSSIETLGTSHTRPATFNIADIISLRSLTEYLMKIIEEEWDSEFDRVWDFVESLTEEERKAVLHTPKMSRTLSDLHRKRRKFSG
jgi:hypothetical protein